MQGVPPLVITGMPRSGTSALARLLATAGLQLGDELMPPSEANRLGFYEDVEFYELNRELLAAALAGEPELQPRWAYAERADLARIDGLREKAEQLVARRMARGHAWGFKDPRATMLLDLYDAIAPGARYLFPYRPPWEVLDSLMRLEGRPLRGRAGFLVRTWVAYNQRLLAFLDEHPERGALVHVSAVESRPADVVALANRLLADAGAPPLGGEPTAATFDSALITRLPESHALAELLAADHPDAVALYERLEARAELPSSALVAPPARRREAVRGSGELALDVVFVGPPDSAPDPGPVRSLVHVEPGADAASAADAANAAVASTDGDLVAVLFGAALDPARLAAAAAAREEEPGTGAVLLGWGDGGGDSVERPSAIELAEGAASYAGVLFERSAWRDQGGFDADLPRADLCAWALAAGCAADGAAVAIVPAVAVGRPDPVEEAERRRVRRHLLERHAALAARSADEAWHELDRTRALAEERTAERDHALEVLATRTEERDTARAVLAKADAELEFLRREREEGLRDQP